MSGTSIIFMTLSRPKGLSTIFFRIMFATTQMAAVDIISVADITYLDKLGLLDMIWSGEKKLESNLPM